MSDIPSSPEPSDDVFEQGMGGNEPYGLFAADALLSLVTCGSVTFGGSNVSPVPESQQSISDAEKSISHPTPPPLNYPTNQ